MRRPRTYLVIALLLAAVTAARVWALPAAAPASQPANAAEHYRQAFKALPSDPSSDDARFLERAAVAPLDEEVTEFLKKHEETLGRFHDGAVIRKVVWETVPKGGDLIFTHYRSLRPMLQLAVLRLRHDLHQKQFAAATQMASDLLSFMRHVGSTPAALAKLKEAEIARINAVMLARLLPQLPPESLRSLEKVLNDLPRSSTPGQSVLDEGALNVRLLRANEGADPQVIFGPNGHYFGLEVNESPERGLADQHLSELWRDPVRREEAIHETDAIYQAAAEAIAAPQAEFPRALDRYRARRDAAGVLTTLLTVSPKNLNEIREAAFVTELNLQLLRAAIRVQLDGRGAVEAFKDPHGDGPFAYSELPNGFRLRSKFQQQGRQISLVVGGESR